MSTTDPTPQQVLNLPLPPDNPSGATTVRGYLIELLAGLWRREDGFSSKRPFGYSGWQHDLCAPLIRAGLISGAFDEDGYLADCDDEAAGRLILAAIRSLGEATP
jgi:hypothetical protein